MKELTKNTMAYFGVDTQVRIEELNLQFANNIRQRQDGFKVSDLRGIFKAMDTNGNGKLDIHEFEAALAHAR